MRETRAKTLLAARDNAEIARDTRWMLPSLNRLGYNEMTLLMDQIEEALDNLHYFVETGDETFSNAMNGEEDEEVEFRAMFAELEAEAANIREMVGRYNAWGSTASDFAMLMNNKERAVLSGECDYEGNDYTTCRAYDDCTVALVGKKYNFGVDGYDVYERDVFGLDESGAEYATEAAKERLMRLKKKDMVELVGQSVSIMLRFQTFYMRYELLTQTFEQIRGANLETLNLMREINAQYEILAAELETNKRYGIRNIYGVKASAVSEHFDSLLEKLPDRFWVE